MNVLDENIFELHRQQLEAWNIRVRQVGVDIGKLGMDDREEIIPGAKQPEIESVANRFKLPSMQPRKPRVSPLNSS